MTYLQFLWVVYNNSTISTSYALHSSKRLKIEHLTCELIGEIRDRNGNMRVIRMVFLFCLGAPILEEGVNSLCPS